MQAWERFHAKALNNLRLNGEELLERSLGPTGSTQGDTSDLSCLWAGESQAPVVSEWRGSPAEFGVILTVKAMCLGWRDPGRMFLQLLFNLCATENQFSSLTPPDIHKSLAYRSNTCRK